MLLLLNIIYNLNLVLKVFSVVSITLWVSINITLTTCTLVPLGGGGVKRGYNVVSSIDPQLFVLKSKSTIWNEDPLIPYFLIVRSVISKINPNISTTLIGSPNPQKYLSLESMEFSLESIIQQNCLYSIVHTCFKHPWKWILVLEFCSINHLRFFKSMETYLWLSQKWVENRDVFCYSVCWVNSSFQIENNRV